MANKGMVSACNSGLRDFNGIKKYGTECRISYLPTNFDLSGVFIEIDPTLAVGSMNDSIQQFAMDTINIEVPGAITSRDDIRLQGGFTK